VLERITAYRKNGDVPTAYRKNGDVPIRRVYIWNTKKQANKASKAVRSAKRDFEKKIAMNIKKD